jgi:hypothetical protein
MRMGGCGLYQFVVKYGKVGDCCEKCNELSVSTTFGALLEQQLVS